MTESSRFEQVQAQLVKQQAAAERQQRDLQQALELQGVQEEAAVASQLELELAEAVDQREPQWLPRG